MAFYEVHATINGADIESKKALIEAIKNDPSSVNFARVSMFNTDVPKDFDISWLVEGVRLQPTGPNPSTSRKWYAVIELVKGKVKVS